MPSEQTGKVQRLHPLSLLFSLGAAAKGLLFPAIALLFVSRGSNYEIWFAFFFIPAAIIAVVKYVFYSYRLGEDEMMVRDGILTRNERHIPYARIQNVNLIQNPFHRALNVAEVHLETASGSKPEAILRVLSLASVDAIRERVNRERGGTTDRTGDAGEVQERDLLALSTRELVTLGLISNRGMAVIAALLGILWQFDFWDLDWERVAEQAPAVAERVGLPSQPPDLAISIVLGVLVVLLGIVLMKLLSVVWAIFRFHGFSLARSGRDLRARYGLFTRYTATIPVHRIQLLSSRTTPMHRWFGRAGVLAETAGGGAGGAEDGEGQSVTHRLWLAPIIDAGAVPEFSREVMPDADLASVEWQRLPSRARSRLRNRLIVIVSLVSAAAVAAFGWWSAIVAAIGYSWAFLHASMWWRHAAWALTPNAVAYRSGWWTRRASIVRFAKIQTVSLSSTPFDRRHGMARLDVDTAGAGKVGHRLNIPFLPLEIATGLHQRLGVEAAQRSFRW